MFRYQLALPAGATLTAAGGGGARSRAAAACWPIVAPPTARDAQGQAVPTSLSVAGSDVVVSVLHRGRDVAYPVELDPTVQNGPNMTWSGGGNTSLITATQAPSLTAAAGSYAGGETGRGLSEDLCMA